jgi:hypothetical protein
VALFTRGAFVDNDAREGRRESRRTAPRARALNPSNREGLRGLRLPLPREELEYPRPLVPRPSPGARAPRGRLHVRGPT